MDARETFRASLGLPTGVTPWSASLSRSVLPWLTSRWRSPCERGGRDSDESPRRVHRRTGHRDRGPGGHGSRLGTVLVVEPVAGSETVSHGS